MMEQAAIALHFTSADVFPEEDAAKDGRAGIGVGISEQHAELAISIDDGEGNCLIAYLDPETLDSFAADLALAIDRLNAAERAALGPSNRLQ